MDIEQDKSSRTYFVAEIEKVLEDSHFVHQDVFIPDALSVQSDNYNSIISKPERYSSLVDNACDVVLSHRSDTTIDRVVILRTLDDLKENGWIYQEMNLLCESLGFQLDTISLTEMGIQDYFKRIEMKEILSLKEERLKSPIAFPKAFFKDGGIESDKIRKAFKSWLICPHCAEKVAVKMSDQESYKDKKIYICENTECDFKIALPK